MTETELTCSQMESLPRMADESTMMPIVTEEPASKEDTKTGTTLAVVALDDQNVFEQTTCLSNGKPHAISISDIDLDKS